MATQKTDLSTPEMKPEIKPEIKKEQAQKLIDRAYQDKDLGLVEAAQQALALDPDCADAYLILAQEVAETQSDMARYYRMAVESGRKALDDRVFDQETGNFWDFMETRTYLHALYGLARSIWLEGNHREALELYEDLLSLDRDDHLGIRYLITSAYLEVGHSIELLERIIQEQEHDPSAFWTYAEALSSYQLFGNSEGSRDRLKNAKLHNAKVVPFLLAKKPLPTQIPEDKRPGSEGEAAFCAIRLFKAWRNTPGAVEWLSGRVRKYTYLH